MLAVIAMTMTNGKKCKHSYPHKAYSSTGMQNQQAGNDSEEAMLTGQERRITKTPEVREGPPQPFSWGPAAGLASSGSHTLTPAPRFSSFQEQEVDED